jgi:cytoskeletal protein CcmA (bactofilin family)
MSFVMKDKGLLQKGGPVNGTTIIAADTVCTGNLESGNDLRIDGTIHGDVICKSKVVVGNGGQIFGNIRCAQADIIGHVTGNVAASESLSLRNGAKLVGDIHTPMLQMENGVLFEGHCRMGAIPEGHPNTRRTKNAKEILAENVN